MAFDTSPSSSTPPDRAGPGPGPGDLRDLVCVAICTCDRHAPLRRTLQSLLRQSVRRGFRVIVADNGLAPAEAVVAAFRDGLDIVFERVETPGLTAVRNRSLALARDSGARFLACIDDDETAEPEWLANHLDEMEQSNADIQVGFIEPRFLSTPPDWIVAGGFHVDDSGVPTTANLLLRLSVLPDSARDWFSPAYSASGGEDHEFITRLVRGGARYHVAPHARVIDMVPVHRLTLRFVLRRGLRDGVYFALWSREDIPSIAMRTLICLRKVAAKLGYAVNHLVWSPGAPWRARRAGVDLATALGIVLGLAGVRPRFYGHAPRRGASRAPRQVKS